jgi:Kef-type K+ transport system membrane component KefB
MLASILHPAPHANVAGPTLVAYVLLDVFLIVVLARILGNLMVKVRQPRVVGEILAGVLLGPTLLGADLSLFIAPAEARPAISSLATLALILFMFLAGVEYDTSVIKGRVGNASILAVLSVAVPAVLGVGVAVVMHNATYTGENGADFLPFALFIGAALAVTAFPVMAHILMERGELNSPMGSLGVATTGIMSILMFTYIGFAGAVASRDYDGLLLHIGLIVVFLVVSAVVVRPYLDQMLRRTYSNGEISGGGMAIIFAGMVLWGLIADRIGINALVGGFIWGALLPTDLAFRQAVAAKIHDIAMILLLPIFFALAGFSTDLKLIKVETIPVVLLVLAAAIAGKFLAAVPAKSMGLSWPQTGIIGSLMNARGLLVLVAGLIGLNFGIINTTTFTIIVVVALVTNIMTLPLLEYFGKRGGAEAALVAGNAEEAAALG